MKTSLLFFTVTSALALALEPIGKPGPFDDQAGLDRCTVAKTTTRPYDAALRQKKGICPKDYWNVASVGCCPIDAVGKTVGNVGVACCQCDAICTGYMPKASDWIVSPDVGRMPAPVPAQATRYWA